MAEPNHDDPFVAHTGSPEAASLLRRNLTAIADQHRGTSLARTVRQVLAGQRDLSALEHDPDFMHLMRKGVRQYEDHLASMSPEQKARLYTEAEEILDRVESPDDTLPS